MKWINGEPWMSVKIFKKHNTFNHEAENQMSLAV